VQRADPKGEEGGRCGSERNQARRGGGKCNRGRCRIRPADSWALCDFAEKVWSLLFSVVQNALRMKGFTIVLVGLDLLLVNMILSGALKPGSDLVGWVGLLRVPAIICLIIGFIRLARENRQRKSS